jgi:outer membrane immunogenic protein
MTKLLLAGVTLAALAVGGQAMAADLPAAPVYNVVTPIYDWTGFYVGANGGYSWGNSSTGFTLAGFAPFSGSEHMNGWVVGGQAGHNWQLNSNFVFGVEADIQAAGQDSTFNAASGPICATTAISILSTTTCTTAATSFEQKLPWLGTGRLRLGFLPADHWMLYVTGGAAFAQVDSSVSVSTATTATTSLGGVPIGSTTTTAIAAANASTTRAGWAAGGGAEWVLSGPWTAKLEYLFVDLGTFAYTYSLLGVPVLAASSRVTDNIVRIGLNYRFGDGPVVASY